MEKKIALITLIKSSVLTDNTKQQLLFDVENMNESQINELGRVLAIQKQKEVKNSKLTLAVIDDFLDKIKG